MAAIAAMMAAPILAPMIMKALGMGGGIHQQQLLGKDGHGISQKMQQLVGKDGHGVYKL